MRIDVELFLRDQIIHGELVTTQPRPLDQINSKLETFLLIENARAASLHVSSPPVRLGTVRVEKEQILLVVPHDSGVTVPGPIRGGWVQKRQLQAMIGLGPLWVKCDLFVSSHDQVSLTTLGRARDGQLFLVASNASISSAYHPEWAMPASTVFLYRTAISYLALPTLTSDVQAIRPDQRLIDARYRGRPAGTKL
jgi:hypothetical protein